MAPRPSRPRRRATAKDNELWVRGRAARLSLDDLYRRGGEYEYSNGDRALNTHTLRAYIAVALFPFHKHPRGAVGEQSTEEIP